MSTIIEIQNFTKKYGGFTAVDDITFDVEEGTIFSFLGPNGAGKSTTINTLCTIFEKTSGSLKIGGYDVSTQKSQVRSLIGVVFQESTLDTKMTLEENLQMHCHFYGVDQQKIAERVDFALEVVDLKNWRKKLVSSLSGGMKRRAEIGRSILHLPRVLFLDEPTTGLDPQTRAHMWNYIVALQKEHGITVFLTTHYMDEAEISSKVAIIDGGKIADIDTPFALKRKYTHDRAYITSDVPKEFENLLVKSNIEYKPKQGYYSVDADNLAALLQVIAAHKDHITEMELKKGTLNDVFLDITGKDIRG